MLPRRINEVFNLNRFFDSCGACSLWKIRRTNIKYLKIAGRGFPYSMMRVNDVLFIKGILNCINEVSGENEFIQQARSMYSDIYGCDCSPAVCYYK